MPGDLVLGLVLNVFPLEKKLYVEKRTFIHVQQWQSESNERKQCSKIHIYIVKEFGISPSYVFINMAPLCLCHVKSCYF